MNKKDKTEISCREKKVKRLKTQHGRPNINSITPVNTDCFRLEEQENIDNCYKKFLETCEKLRHFFVLISQSKKAKASEDTVHDYRVRIFMLIMCLKKLNRLDKHQWKKSRDKVNERKQIVDNMHLQYQNLLYEATHLQKEVNKCLEFRSKDEEIELVSIDEFYRDAPESISKPEITKHNEHELMLARLLWETEQRKRFAIKLKEAEVKKQAYHLATQKLQDNLSNILPILKSILGAAEPFSGKLGMPFQKMQLKHKIAKYLPRHLYTLYVQVSAYQEHCKMQKIEISVEGNVDDAKALNSKTSDMSEDSGESDIEDSSEMKSHRHADSQKKKTVSKDVLLKHPMSVLITIEKEFKLVLEFKYLVSLQILTVTVKSFTPEPMSTDLIGDLLRMDTILSCLYPEDTGHDTPNLASIYKLKINFGFEIQPFTNDTTGLPYLWVQKLAGIEFLNPVTPDVSGQKKVNKLIPASVEKTFSAIFDRLTSRHCLYNQIITLDQKISVPPTFTALYPANISSQFKKWYPVPWKKVLNHPNIVELQELGIVSAESLIYKAEIQRGSASLSTLVVVPHEYPAKTPVFFLQLSWKGAQTAVSNSALRELEEEVNFHFVEALSSEFKDYLLSCQLYHLIVSFDIFLETQTSEDSFEGPHEIVREKVVVRNSRGPSRSRPYKCISSQGIFAYR